VVITSGDLQYIGIGISLARSLSLSSTVEEEEESITEILRLAPGRERGRRSGHVSFCYHFAVQDCMYVCACVRAFKRRISLMHTLLMIL
jgi:hypothetical protein